MDVCKKLELTPLRFDRDMRVLSLIKNIIHFFYFRILFYSKNGEVCKKLVLNMLRFDRDMRVSISKKNFPANEKHCQSANFQDFFEFLVRATEGTSLYGLLR